MEGDRKEKGREKRRGKGKEGEAPQFTFLATPLPAAGERRATTTTTRRR